MNWVLLQGVPEEDRRRVLAVGVRHRYPRGETIFHEGDAGDSLHLVVQGLIAVRMTTPLGQVATLAVRGRGDVFGELAVVSPDAHRSATVSALERTDTIAVTRGQFEHLRHRHPSVDRFLVGILAAQLRRTSMLLEEALFADAEKRMWRRLLEVRQHYATADGAVDVPLTQEALAEMAGTTRSTVNRALRDAEGAGVIALRRGHVVILDLDDLRRRAH